MPGSPPALAVVIVTHHSADHLPATLAALTSQLLDDDELLIVDNASTDDTCAVARRAAPRAEVLETGANLGFAGGCNAGAAATSAPLLLFLNPDARPAAGCLAALRAAADAHPDWGAWQALVTLPGGERVNTSGGIVHFLGFGWAGECSRPLPAAGDREVGFASGAALAVRRTAWEQVDGFDPAYFMYGEDLDLSLRLRLAGYGIGLARDAVVEHDYDFDKGSRKWRLLERNRWRTLLADYPAGLLLALAPALLAAEVVLLLLAARGGWLHEKLRAHVDVVAALPGLLRRRARVQRLRRVSTAQFATALVAELDSPYLPVMTGPLAPVAALQRTCWRATRRVVEVAGA